MQLAGSANGQHNAKHLRQQMTQPEIALWLALWRNALGLRFRRQHAAGDYVLDFFCAPARLVIEVDCEAHNRGDRPARDARRDAWLRSQGLRVLRDASTDILTNLDRVMMQIMKVAEERRCCSGETARPPPPSRVSRATSPW